MEESNKSISGVCVCVTTGAMRVVGVVGEGVKGTSSFGLVGDWNGGVLLDMVGVACCLH